MRKLLLASVAVLGASMGLANVANAQTAASLPGDELSGQSFPTPGSVTVRLNGRFRFYAGAFSQGAARTSNFAQAATGGVTAATTGPGGTAVPGIINQTTSNQGTNKLSGYGVSDYARLYPGFDGVATNGLKYGASLEIRADNNYGAGGGFAGSVTGQNRTRDALYFRRQWGYIGTDKFGTVRVGSTDNPGSLYLTGTFENFDAGGLNGDIPGMFLPGNLQINYPFASVGNVYSTTKIVYLSPQFFGVDFGVSWEPTTANGGEANAAGCGPTPSAGQFSSSPNSVATPGCDNLSSTSTSDIGRRKNTYEALVRYRGTFGPLGLAATAQYTGSGRVLDSGVPGAAANPQRVKNEDLSLGDFGVAVTFAGLTVGGNYMLGRYNVPGGGGYGGLIAKGQPNSNALIVGASYTIGPVVMGAHYLRSQSQGDQATATNRSGTGVPLALGGVTGGQRVETGIAAGATYSLAPGVSLFASYVYEERKQNGFNFITGASNNASNNKVSAQVFAVGTGFAW